MNKREWQIEMANRFVKRKNDIEELDARSYLLGRYDSTNGRKELTDEEIVKLHEETSFFGVLDPVKFARAILRKAQEK